MNNLSRNQTPKLMLIKTVATFCKGNWQACAKTKEVTEISPIKIALNSKKSERNTIVHLPKSAKKLDGEETRTILLNGHKVIPSNRMPNTSKVNVHTCFLENVRIEGSGMTKASIFLSWRRLDARGHLASRGTVHHLHLSPCPQLVVLQLAPRTVLLVRLAHSPSWSVLVQVRGNDESSTHPVNEMSLILSSS